MHRSIPACLKDCIWGYPNTASKIYSGVRGKAFFQGDRLEKVVKELLRCRGIDPDTLLKDSEHARCKVYVIFYFPFWMALVPYYF